MAMERKLAHLEMIQTVLNRMATNSFHLKGWTVTLVAALFVLSAQHSSAVVVYLAYFPAMAFWVLDAFFLHQEKRFRALYDHVRQLPEAQIDFSMDTVVVSDQVHPWPDVIFSRTMLLFHGVVLVSIVIVLLMLPRIVEGS